MVLQFLDADEYELRLNILAGLHHRITDEMITTMAIACDVEIEEGLEISVHRLIDNKLLSGLRVHRHSRDLIQIPFKMLIDFMWSRYK